jgi:hypothetical protein
VLLSLKLIVCEGSIPCIILPGSCVSLAVKYILLILALVVCAWTQSQPEQPKNHPEQRHDRGPGKEIGSGAGDVGKGAAKGAGNVAKDTGKSALDLVTLHPINAATSVGKGAAVGGKDVAEGTVKGTGKIGKGIGKAFKKLF